VEKFNSWLYGAQVVADKGGVALACARNNGNTVSVIIPYRLVRNTGGPLAMSLLSSGPFTTLAARDTLPPERSSSELTRPVTKMSRSMRLPFVTGQES
jgi:hypothetical protein